MFRSLKNCFLIVLFLFSIRYGLAVLINHTFPARVWNDADSSFILKDSPLELGHRNNYNPVNFWLRWDTSFYLQIVQNGYDRHVSTTEYSNLAFFPLYPLLIKLFSFGSHNYIVQFIAGLFISNALFALALYFFYKILLDHLELPENLSVMIIALFLVFPGSYFFNLIYTESLFLFLSVLSIHMLFSRKFLLTSFLIGLLGITRINGLGMLVPFVYFYISDLIEQKNLSFVKFLKLLSYLFISFLPLFLHFSHLREVTGNFFASFAVQKAWNNTGFVPFGFFVSYLKLFGLSIRLEYILGVLMVFLCIALLFPLKSYFKSLFGREVKVMSLWVFLLTNMAIITSVTNLSSIIRYVSVLFPVFIFSGILFKDKLVIYAPYIYTLCLVLQTVFYTMFLVNVSAYGF